MWKKLDDRTSIPLAWVLCAYVPTTTFVVGVALWVYNVDNRLGRIEQKLGISAVSAQSNPIIKSAEAKEN